MTALRILLLSDGRPGHYHLAEGVCAALARLRPIEVVTVAIKRRLPTRVLLGAIADVALGQTSFMRLGYGLTSHL